MTDVFYSPYPLEGSSTIELGLKMSPAIKVQRDDPSSSDTSIEPT